MREVQTSQTPKQWVATTLEPFLKLKIHPRLMEKCGTIISNLDEAGYHRANINDVINALFADQSDKATRRCWQVFNPHDEASIDGKNFRRIMPLIAYTMTEEELTELYNKADLDGSGEIEFEEFVFLIRHLNPRPTLGGVLKFEAEKEMNQPPKMYTDGKHSCQLDEFFDSLNYRKWAEPLTKKKLFNVLDIAHIYPYQLVEKYEIPMHVAKVVFDKAASWLLHEEIKEKSRGGREKALVMQEKASMAQAKAQAHRGRAVRIMNSSEKTRRVCAVGGSFGHIRTFSDITNDYLNDGRPCSRASAQPAFSRAWAADGPNTPTTTPVGTNAATSDDVARPKTVAVGEKPGSLVFQVEEGLNESGKLGRWTSDGAGAPAEGTAKARASTSHSGLRSAIFNTPNSRPGSSSAKSRSNSVYNWKEGWNNPKEFMRPVTSGSIVGSSLGSRRGSRSRPGSTPWENIPWREDDDFNKGPIRPHSNGSSENIRPLSGYSSLGRLPETSLGNPDYDVVVPNYDEVFSNDPSWYEKRFSERRPTSGPTSIVPRKNSVTNDWFGAGYGRRPGSRDSNNNYDRPGSNHSSNRPVSNQDNRRPVSNQDNRRPVSNQDNRRPGSVNSNRPKSGIGRDGPLSPLPEIKEGTYNYKP